MFEVKPFMENKAMMLSDEEANYTQISIMGNAHKDSPIITEKTIWTNLLMTCALEFYQ